MKERKTVRAKLLETWVRPLAYAAVTIAGYYAGYTQAIIDEANIDRKQKTSASRAPEWHRQSIGLRLEEPEPHNHSEVPKKTEESPSDLVSVLDQLTPPDQQVEKPPVYEETPQPTKKSTIATRLSSQWQRCADYRMGLSDYRRYSFNEGGLRKEIALGADVIFYEESPIRLDPHRTHTIVHVRKPKEGTFKIDAYFGVCTPERYRAEYELRVSKNNPHLFYLDGDNIDTSDKILGLLERIDRALINFHANKPAKLMIHTGEQ